MDALLIGFLIVFGAAVNAADFTLTDDGPDATPTTLDQKSLINDYFKRYLLTRINEQERIQHDRNMAENQETLRSGWGPLFPTTTTTPQPPPPDSDIQTSWSITWYIVSFSGLIAFFVIISCSEWCCRRRNRPVAQQVYPPGTPLGSLTQTSLPLQESLPPPAYDLFAPPSYDSVNERRVEKTEFDVYVVPVHAITSVLEADAPPSYTAINRNGELNAGNLSNPDSEYANTANTHHSDIREGCACEGNAPVVNGALRRGCDELL